MNELDFLPAILESLVEPIVFVDTGHIIRFVNQAARKKYAKRVKGSLVGMSIFGCHKEKSNTIIRKILEQMQNEGLDEQFLHNNKIGQKIYMRAVRDSSGNLLGYYERFEKA